MIPSRIKQNILYQLLLQIVSVFLMWAFKYDPGRPPENKNINSWYNDDRRLSLQSLWNTGF